MPDFGDIPNLEVLDLEGCIKLVQIDPSIGVLKKLYFLNLEDCKNLVNIPNNIFGLTSLKYLNLSGCPKLNKNPIPRQLKNLDSSESSSHSQSRTFSFYDYHEGLASCLSEIDISFCGLSQLPGAIGCLRQLESLNIAGNNFVTLPNLKELSNLEYLNLKHCKLLESLPQLPFPTFFDHMTKHKTTLKRMENYYWRKVGLIIFNCPKLGESEHCDSIAFLWMAQFIQARQQSSYDFCDKNRIDIVIPRSEIPIWFKNQSEGGSIRIELSTIMDNNCIGISFCVVFSVKPDQTEAQYSKIILQFLNSERNKSFFYHSIPTNIERDLIVVKSNHMCLCYIPMRPFFDKLKEIDQTHTHRDDIIMSASCWNYRSVALKFQHCGYRLVYEHDLQDFNLTMMHPGNLSTHKSKFLAIE
ncbi:hypothetical protein TSUD_142240 [Trifolium subterraneum]|uniref:C-JID domain-containing protein n=1 Tax=Trifolium subterraneum TaxID=3900 RepID=A0A2Z6MI11_TRISU|nr:hypothetical protein TSUD_142240 [Trifolium subterraneum]